MSFDIIDNQRNFEENMSDFMSVSWAVTNSFSASE